MKIDMLCNAHLDPVWQWNWEEGAAQAVSTFRAAADLCEEFEGFIFNHNESILYEWVEEYEPELFARIQKLVKEGRWHIMGGWYLQPDMNMPSGESIFRQIETGQSYFQEKFGVRPTTAINFDSFGHSRGAVQIFTASGYDSYIFMRPEEELQGNPGTKLMPLEGDNFIWRGFDGSEVTAHRIQWGYNSHLGKAAEKIRNYATQRTESPGFAFWGVGNHGGGPSRKDIADLNELIKEMAEKSIELRHSNAEDYFKKLTKDLPVLEKSLRPTNVGCYTSQVLIKQKHRELENILFATEKMVTVAVASGLMEYPHKEFMEAQKYLLTAQFHDILPGTSVPSAEANSIDMLGCGISIISKIRARAFFALCSGLPQAKENEYPILVFNPHPYTVEACIDCEYQLADQNWSNDEFYLPAVYHNGTLLPSQQEKEAGNIPIDWRKRVVFEGTLAPLSISRFSVKHTMGPWPAKTLPVGGFFQVESGGYKVAIDSNTGMLSHWSNGKDEFINQGTGKLAVLFDSEDSWGMTTTAFDKIEGYFEPASPERAKEIMGVSGDFCHVTEDGPVRMAVETILTYKTSTAVLTWYLYKNRQEIDLSVRLYWNEKDRMVKFLLKPAFEFDHITTQEMYGASQTCTKTTEQVTQKWITATSSNSKVIGVLNEGSHGYSCLEDSIGLTLLRSPAYTGHYIHGRDTLPQERFSPRIDQGERLFNFKLVAGDCESLRPKLDGLALEFNEKPFVLSFFPAGYDRPVAKTPIIIDNPAIVLSSLRVLEDGSIMARLYNSTGKHQNATLKLVDGLKKQITLEPWKITTLKMEV